MSLTPSTMNFILDVRFLSGLSRTLSDLISHSLSPTIFHHLSWITHKCINYSHTFTIMLSTHLWTVLSSLARVSIRASVWHIGVMVNDSLNMLKATFIKPLHQISQFLFMTLVLPSTQIKLWSVSWLISHDCLSFVKSCQGSNITVFISISSFLFL